METIQNKEQIYKDIVNKLGFKPENYIPEQHKIHDDNYESPLSKLDLDELHYLLNNNFFKQ